MKLTCELGFIKQYIYVCVCVSAFYANALGRNRTVVSEKLIFRRRNDIKTDLKLGMVGRGLD